MAVMLNGSPCDPHELRPGERATGQGPCATISDPVTCELLASLPTATTHKEATRILDSAEAGFATWSQIPLWQRADSIVAFAWRLNDARNEVSTLMARNMGRPIRECRDEVDVAVALTRGFAERAKHLYGQVMPQSQAGLESDIVFTRREPLGIILAIVPFNAPVELFVHKVIPALLMGNSVVVKMPEPNPLCQVELTQMLLDVGVDADALNLVYAYGEFTSTHLVQSPRLAAVTFTGSTATGTAINRQAAAHLHHVMLELGGNDPFILAEGVDVHRAARAVVTSRTMNSGQVCCASKRTLVPRHLVDEFTTHVDNELERLVQGNPLDPGTDVGALISEDAAQRVKQQVQRTVEQGAKCVRGGEVRNGVFFEPTLLVDADHTMDAACDMEIFGPVITVIAYDNLDEAIEIANQTAYGLQASVMAAKTEDAMKIAERLRAGMVVVNGAGSYRHIDMPFGGTKQSGIGREGVSATLEEFSEEKSFVLKGMLG